MLEKESVAENDKGLALISAISRDRPARGAMGFAAMSAKDLVESMPSGYDFGPAMSAAADKNHLVGLLCKMAGAEGGKGLEGKAALVKGIVRAAARGDEEGYQTLMAVGGYPSLPKEAIDQVVSGSDQRMVLAVLPFVDKQSPGASISIVAAIERFGLDEAGTSLAQAELRSFAKDQARNFEDPVIKKAMLGYDGVEEKAAVIAACQQKFSTRLGEFREFRTVEASEQKTSGPKVC